MEFVWNAKSREFRLGGRCTREWDALIVRSMSDEKGLVRPIRTRGKFSRVEREKRATENGGAAKTTGLAQHDLVDHDGALAEAGQEDPLWVGVKLSDGSIDKGIYSIAAEPDVRLNRFPFPEPSIAASGVGKRPPWRYDYERVGQLSPKANHVVFIGTAPMKHHDQRRMVGRLRRFMHEVRQFFSRRSRVGPNRDPKSQQDECENPRGHDAVFYPKCQKGTWPLSKLSRSDNWPASRYLSPSVRMNNRTV